MYNFFNSNSFGKAQKRQIRQALEANNTDRLCAILTNYEPDVNANSYGLIDCFEFHTLLTYAAFRGHLDIIKMLVETFHVDCDKRDERKLMTPLMYASLYNGTNLDVVRYLREECSVDIECVTQEGFTAAELARQNDNVLIHEYLSNPVPEEKASRLSDTEAPATEDPEEDARRQSDEEQRIRITSLESALQEANHRCSRLSQEIASMSDVYKTVQDHCQFLEKENTKLLAQVKQDDERRERIKRKYEAALSEAQDEVTKLRRKMLSNHDSSALKEENAQLRRELSGLREENSQIQQQALQELTEGQRREEALTAELNSLRMQLAEKEKQGEERKRIEEDCEDFVVIEPPEESSRY